MNLRPFIKQAIRYWLLTVELLITVMLIVGIPTYIYNTITNAPTLIKLIIMLLVVIFTTSIVGSMAVIISASINNHKDS